MIDMGDGMTLKFKGKNNRLIPQYGTIAKGRLSILSSLPELHLSQR